jgi:hypothetical protein
MASANPGRRDGGSKLDCHVCERVLNAGGATHAAAVATWACVRMHGDVLIVGSVLRSHAARRFQMCSRLMGSVGGAVGLLVGALLMGTLRNGVFMSIERVIFLLASVWGMDILAVICTLRTHCTRGVSVAVCSNRSGCAFICACVASTIPWRSFVARECLSLPVMPWIALMQSANACITLLACVMEGLVMRLCWNCKVLDRHSLLVCFTWQLCVQ